MACQLDEALLAALARAAEPRLGEFSAQEFVNVGRVWGDGSFMQSQFANQAQHEYSGLGGEWREE